MAKTSSSLPVGGNLLHNTLLGLNDGDYQHLTILEKANLEFISNKQNSLAVDGTGIKYPTVDALNNAIAAVTVPDATLTIKGKLKLAGDLSGTADLPLINVKTINSTSIKGSGDIIIDKTFVGLGNVDNTSDLNKPISINTQIALNLKENKSEKNQINGYAGLDGSGKIFSNQLPALAITDTYVVASQAAMLNLTLAETGDVVVRTDLNKTFILKGTIYSTLSDWQELLTPTDSVFSVFGRTGTVTANPGDYDTSLIPDTINARYQTDNQKSYNDATSSIQTQLNNRELLGINSIAEVYVETNGNDSTAILGNKRKPFLTIDAALDALPVTGGIIKIGIGTFSSPIVAKIKSNTAFIGSKEPIIDSTITFSTPTARPTITAPTALIDGTILNGQFRIEDRNNIRIENLGVDVGKTWIDTYNSGTAVNAMAILSTVSTTPCKNITVNNSTVLGYSPTALFHAFVFQHVTDSHFSNLTSFYNTHGLVIKGTNITVDGLNAHSHTADGLNIKSDVYAPCSDVSVSNINISSLSAYESGGIALDEGGSGAPTLERIDLSNLNLKYVKYGIINVNKVSNVNISNFNLYDSETTGINFGGGNVDKINLSGINIVKTITEGVKISLSGSAVININNSNVSDATTTGYALTTAGTSIINIVNSNTLTTTASYLITGSGVYGNSNFGTGTKTGVINFKSQSITDSVSGVNFFTGLATQTVNMLALPTGTISFANANTSTSPTIYSKSSNSRGLLVMTGTPDVNASADMEFGVRENDNTDFTTLTSSAFRFTRFGTTLIDVLRNGNTTFAGNISAPLFTGSAVLTGDPKAPTPTAGDNDTSIATTAFVQNAVSAGASGSTYTPTFSSLTNISSPVDGLTSSYIKVGNIVTVMIMLSCTVTVANTFSSINVTLPINRANVTGAVQIGSCSIQDTAQTTQGSSGVASSTSVNMVSLSLKPLLSGSARLTAQITYNVLQ